MISFYTDGAYSSKMQKGGWAFYCPEYHLRLCGNATNTTINRMELLAAIKVLEFIEDANIEEKEITIFSDSMYLVGGASLGWSQAKNTDLWDQLNMLIEGMFAKKIYFKHIDGHCGIDGNEIADSLAVKLSQL